MTQGAVASYLEAEVKCYHCGHLTGVVRRDRGVANAPTTFVSTDGAAPRIVRSLTALRCTRCHGSVYMDDFDVKYVYPRIDFLEEDRPRRGRPPKRLVELRKAREAALLSA
jgi:hypothetical protein